MGQIKFDRFDAGWIPSDDAFNGRKNGLLKMDGVTLDENGSIVMANGTKKIDFEYPAAAHTLFSRFVCGERRRYLALEDGSVYRNEDEIIAAGEGSTTRAAFGIFGNFVIIASGATKIKDICDEGIGDLGLEAPDDSLDVFGESAALDEEPIGDVNNFVETAGTGTSAVSVVDGTLQMFIDGTGGARGRLTVLNDDASDFPPKDLAGSDDDIFSFQVKCDVVNDFWSMTFYFVGTNAEAGTWNATIKWGGENGTFASLMAVADLHNAMLDDIYSTFTAKRSEFVASGNVDWSKVTAVYIQCDSFDDKDITLNFKEVQFLGGDEGTLNGTYQWVQVNVFNDGGFVTKSLPGPDTDPITIVNGFAHVTPFDPTIIAPLANEVWIYRRGGNLPVYYRVKVMTMDELGTFDDTVSDEEALITNVTLDPDVQTIQDDLPAEILEIVGPVHGRMLYFTSTQVFFGEIENPDAFNPSRTLNTTSSEAEKFLWARKVAENVVLIGTSVDIYTLTGSWITYPDGVIDVDIRPLGIDKPPICRDVAVYKGNVAYMSSRGWLLLSLSNDYASLINPSTKLLYDGVTRYDYAGVGIQVEPEFRYPCIIAKDKLYCSVPTISDYTDAASIADSDTWEKRFEVYDFLQKYWRPHPYSPLLLDVEEDGTLLGFFDNNFLAEIEYPHSKRLNFVE